MTLITLEQLKKIYRNGKEEKLKLYVEAFNQVFPKFEINTPKRIAAFLGQVAVESGELKYDRELPSRWNKKNPKDANEQTGSLYENRKLLGNNKPGDGPKYIGRGILQLTGRANYTDMSKKLNRDLVNNPELACDPMVSVEIACQYFKDRKLLAFSDAWNLDEVTKRVNGSAKLHHDQRVAYSEMALRVLSGK